MTHALNKRRLTTAEKALNTYKAIPGCDGDDLTDIGDLIVNLLHLAAAKGEEDMRWFVERQLDHFICESEEPDDIELSFRELAEADTNNAA